MGIEGKEVTVEELVGLIQSQQGEFIIHVEPRRMQMEKQEPFQLDVVSIRLVRNAPLFSDRKITGPKDAVSLVGEMLCEMDREVVCVINLKSDGTPINCNFASMGAINQAVAEPRELFKSAILSNAAKMILVHNQRQAGAFQGRYDYDRPYLKAVLPFGNTAR